MIQSRPKRRRSNGSRKADWTRIPPGERCLFLPSEISEAANPDTVCGEITRMPPDPDPTTWRRRKSGGGLFFATGLLVLLLTGITMSPFPDLWPGFLISLLFSLYGLLRASSPRQRLIGIGLSFAAGLPGLLSLVAFAPR